MLIVIGVIIYKLMFGEGMVVFGGVVLFCVAGFGTLVYGTVRYLSVRKELFGIGCGG